MIFGYTLEKGKLQWLHHSADLSENVVGWAHTPQREWIDAYCWVGTAGVAVLVYMMAQVSCSMCCALDGRSQSQKLNDCDGHSHRSSLTSQESLYVATMTRSCMLPLVWHAVWGPPLPAIEAYTEEEKISMGLWKCSERIRKCRGIPKNEAAHEEQRNPSSSH